MSAVFAVPVAVCCAVMVVVVVRAAVDLLRGKQ